MTRYGILLDKTHFSNLAVELEEKIETVRLLIAMEVGKPGFNPGSSQQVSDLIYKDLGLKTYDESGTVRMPPTTHGGRYYSTDDKYLSGFADNPTVSLILEFRELDKMYGTYVRTIIGKADSDDRIRCRWNYADVVTGRLSSADPNMQNWPEVLRAGFIASPGCKLVSHDLSQIEMRVGAHESQDPTLMKAFHEGLDTHTMTAAYVFYRDLALTAIQDAMALVDKKTQRAPCKTVNFGIFYGQTAEGLQMGLAGMGIFQPLQWCQWLIDEWYRIYSGVTEYLHRAHYRARRYGMVWCMFGRSRLVPETKSALNGIISAGLRQAGNMPIQAGAQGIFKIGMYSLNHLYDAYEALGVVCRPLLQIHDEMISEVSEEVAQDFAEQGKSILETCVPLSVPLGCGYGIGNTWGDLK